VSRLNAPVARIPVYTHEGGRSQKISPYLELRRTVLSCLLWEGTFYEKGSETARRISELVQATAPEQTIDLAIEARNQMHLRHVPLFLLREVVRHKRARCAVADALAEVIQRPDELSEFLAMYWADGRCPIAVCVKRGLAKAFRKFNEYQLAKYNRDSKIKLRDVLFMVHAKPADQAQAHLWKRLVDGQLESPDTWEVELSTGKDKKETFERLLREKKLGGLAVLRNLRNMLSSGVDLDLIRDRLSQEMRGVLPFRYITAARYAPALEDALESAMLASVADVPKLPGRVELLVDVSGSMDDRLGDKSETTRMDAAIGLAILLREKAEEIAVYTFSEKCVLVPPRRGFALADAIRLSQDHQGTHLARALEIVKTSRQRPSPDKGRMIVITDEQSADGIIQAFTDKAYVLNVGSYQHGIGYGNGWTHIDGWSERVLDYIQAVEADSTQGERL
jgi:60 kDa SS-A/Ro ribonucleoprotein